MVLGRDLVRNVGVQLEHQSEGSGNIASRIHVSISKILSRLDTSHTMVVLVAKLYEPSSRPLGVNKGWCLHALS